MLWPAPGITTFLAFGTCADSTWEIIGSIPGVSPPMTNKVGTDRALSVPTLFVIGGDTPGMLPIISQVLSAHVPNAKKVVIPGAGHSMFRQQPKAFCNAVLSFLASYA